MFQEIIQTIKRDILLGKIKPGEKLLSERKLSEFYGVGRGTIREVLKALEATGLLTAIRGRLGGYFINKHAIEISSGALSSAIRLEGSIITDALNFRKMFEPKTCYYAAIKRTKKNLKAMESSIRDMEAETINPEIFAESNLSFHLEIGKASGNPFIINLYPHVFEMLIDTAKMAYELPTHLGVTRYFHREIYHQIKGRNPEKAEILMDAHLSYFQNDMKQAKDLQFVRSQIE